MPNKKPIIITVHDATEANTLDVELFRWRIQNAENADEQARQIIKRGKIKAEDMANAARRFKDVITETDDWWVLYVAAQFGRIQDDEKSIELFDTALASGWGTGKIKKAVREANGDGDHKLKMVRCKRCQRLDEIMHGRDFIHKAELYQLLNDNQRKAAK